MHRCLQWISIQCIHCIGRELEVARCFHLTSEMVRRDPKFCQHRIDYWQDSVLTPLCEKLITAGHLRLIRSDIGDHEHVGDLATARFVNEAIMVSWLIASQHVVGDFLHSQYCFPIVCGSRFRCCRASGDSCFGPYYIMFRSVLCVGKPISNGAS